MNDRKAYWAHELPEDIVDEIEKGYQGRLTPELDYLMEPEINDRKAHKIAEVPEELANAIEKSEMDSKHEKLNELMNNGSTEGRLCNGSIPLW